MICSNVKIVYYARRDPKAGYLGGFGNCGTKSAPSVSYLEKLFHGTHGAIGGSPGKTAGKSGKIEEMTTNQKFGAVAGGGVLGGAPGGIAAKKHADQNDFTNVTVAQDMACAAKVWDWMSKTLMVARMAWVDQSGGSLATFGNTFVARPCRHPDWVTISSITS